MINLTKNKKKDSIGDMLRFWRKLKRKSQMDLALDIGISSKHLSFVETGKSKPSRDLILKMSHALKLPLRQQNAFLHIGGYAPEYSEEPFAGENMKIVRQALERMLKNHEPYPALVVNTSYKILMTNSGFDKAMTFFLGEDIYKKYDNIFQLTFAEDGLRKYIRDWPSTRHFMLSRLWEEVVSTQNNELFVLHEDILEQQTSEDPINFEIDTNLPIMSLTLEKNDVTASFFTTITTLGTPLDLTTQEIRIESLFPGDEKTRQLFPF